MIASKESHVLHLNGKAVSRETQARLDDFVSLFEQWSSRMNLVAKSTKADLWERHIVDSAQLLELTEGTGNWLDLGSGGGFPGIVTAILLTDGTRGHVDLVESNQKKAAFLRSALIKTKAAGAVHAARIEDCWSKIENVDYISSRALAELDILFDLIQPWAARNADLRAYLHKGRDYQREVDLSHRRWDFDLVEHPSKVEPGSVILEISGLRPKASPTR